jgi:hypothetical protein
VTSTFGRTEITIPRARIFGADGKTAGSAIGDYELRRLQASFDEIIEERPPGSFAFPAHVLDRQEDLCPSCLTARAMRSEIEVDFLSSLTRTTVASRISRVIGSSARERAFQAS